MSLGNDPRRTTSFEAAEAVAAAHEARAELARDGIAPSTEAILREMGHAPNGEPLEDGPDEWIPASTAARRALEMTENGSEADQ